MATTNARAFVSKVGAFAPKARTFAPKVHIFAPKTYSFAPKVHPFAPKGCALAPKARAFAWTVGEDEPKGDDDEPEGDKDGPKGGKDKQKGGKERQKGRKNDPKGGKDKSKGEKEKITIPSDVAGHKALVKKRMESGVLPTTRWSEMNMSSGSRTNDNQFLALGILTKAGGRPAPDGLRNYLPSDTISRAQEAIGNTPMWGYLFRALKAIQPNKTPSFEHTASYFTSGGFSSAKTAGIPGGHWQMFLGHLAAVWVSRVLVGTEDKKHGRYPDSDYSAPTSLRLYHTTPPATGKILATRTEMTVGNLMAAILTMVNHTTLVEESDPKLYWTPDQENAKDDYEARVDGALIVSGSKWNEACILAGGEVKRTIRGRLGEKLPVQEGLETSLCIKRRTPEFSEFPFLLFALDADQLYACFAKPTTGYLSFLQNENHCLDDLADGDYLTIERFGPYSVWQHEDLEDFVTILLAFQIYAYDWRASHLKKQESEPQ